MLTSADRWAMAVADAATIARELRIGDTISYELLEDVGDSVRDEIRRWLADRGLRLEDVGGEYRVESC